MLEPSRVAKSKLGEAFELSNQQLEESISLTHKRAIHAKRQKLLKVFKFLRIPTCSFTNPSFSLFILLECVFGYLNIEIRLKN
jgi:hypothetical protein